MYRYRFPLFLLFILATFASLPVNAQEVEDTIKIKTRVVFLDALVKDKKTNLPISNLTTENFQVLDDGKPRNISYFTREGQARKPLALILILDLREDGAGRFLKRTEILKSMEDELAKLPPGDEVAIMAMDMNNEDEERLWLTEFTNDRAKLAAALARVPAMCVPHEGQPSETKSTEVAKTDDSAGKPGDVVETETIRGRNGGTVIRETHRDGSVNVKRTNKKGDVTIELGDVYDMAAAVKDASRKAEQTRPNSQLSIVWVSDGIAPIFFEDRDATEQILIRNNVIFNSLTVELRTLFKFLLPVAKPIGGWLGMSLYGSAKYLAGQSGGEAVKVGRPKDYGAGLARIIGNLTARYSLGFALAEDEIDDGRMHSLEVRVKAQDEKGKTRKLQVSSRQGYYMSSTIPKDAAAKAQF
ncbi:MAG TPA: VWA domain-containing protein [Pyrinomonadaceae bacterium]|nr:VWA domain-containing protein [Pyrinomonadaceae bacterium]